MSTDTLFSIANTLILPGWLLLVFVPRWSFTFKITFYLIVLVLSIFYASLIIPAMGSMPMDSFSTLEGISNLFSDKRALLAGWIHYLAFDLLIGMGITHDANKNNIKRIFVVPCLFFTLMAGPLGLLLYFILRLISLRTLTLVDN